MTVSDHVVCTPIIRIGRIHMSGSRKKARTPSSHLCSLGEDLTTRGRCAIASQDSLDVVGAVGALANQLASSRTDDQTAAVLEEDNRSQETPLRCMSLPVFCTQAVEPDQGHATGSLCPGVTRTHMGRPTKIR